MLTTGKCHAAIRLMMLLTITVMVPSCEEKKEEPAPRIIYRTDGRSVYVGDVDPIALDINQDDKVDFTIFVVLTANEHGDHLYVGINPIGANTLKSGPAIDEHFQNMGFVPAQPVNAAITNELSGNQQWTMDHSVLLIRHTNNDGSVWYEGDWKDATETMVAIRHITGTGTHFGWLNLQFDKETEYITLIDYAYNMNSNQSIRAGQKND